MGKKLERINLWIRRRSYLPLLLLGGGVVFILYSNEETSISQNMEYDREIRALKQEIQLTRDSTRYYQQKRQALVSGESDLEKVAREQYKMKRSSEDVYLIVE